MAGERYVLVGLARAQSQWFLDVARWSTSGALPAEFLKAVSVEELRARLQSGRAFSALLVDDALPGCDRDLVALAERRGCAVVVVDDRANASSPQQGAHAYAAAVLRSDFARDELLGTLRTVAKPVARADARPAVEPPPDPAPQRWRGRLVAVTGAGGTGRSTVAMALAAGLAADPRDHDLVVLADLALRAHQGLLHDAGDVVPGLSELVDAYRSARLDPADVPSLCFEVAGRGYDLLLGLRRQRDWAALRTPTFGAALDGLRRCYRLVVADVDADVEGEEECGLVELEERNLLARTTLRAADLVVVVGLGGVVGTHGHVQVLRDLVELGVPPDRLLPVVNRAPRNPRARAELGSALVELLEGCLSGPVTLATAPLFVPERRRLDDALRDDGRMPSVLVEAVAGPVRAVLDRLADPTSTDDGGDAARLAPQLAAVAVAPGSLGQWSLVSTEPGS